MAPLGGRGAPREEMVAIRRAGDGPHRLIRMSLIGANLLELQAFRNLTLVWGDAANAGSAHAPRQFGRQTAGRGVRGGPSRCHSAHFRASESDWDRAKNHPQPMFGYRHDHIRLGFGQVAERPAEQSISQDSGRMNARCIDLASRPVTVVVIGKSPGTNREA